MADRYATIEKWKAVESWIALVQLNREFIAGKDVGTIYRGVPLSDETKELIPGLLRLHEYRLLTVKSLPQPMNNPELCQDGKFWIEYKRIPFVEFFMPYEGKTTEAFISNMVKDSQLKTYVFDCRKSPDTLWPGSNTVAIGVEVYRTSTSLAALPSEIWEVGISVGPGKCEEEEEGSCESESESEDEDEDKDKEFSSNALYNYWLSYIPAAGKANPLYCAVVTVEKINLLARVEEHAIQAGLERTSFDTS